MSKPAFIVDGQQEQKILQKICPGSPVRRLNCNGEAVELIAAAKRAASLIRLIGDGFYPIIIVFDREKRSKTAEKIREELRDLISREGITTEVIVGVPDRMIENWILADWETVSTQGQLGGNRPDTVEGRNGKSLICRSLPRGRYYHETIEGVDWFLRVRPQIVYDRSESFRQFLDCVTAVNCEWFRQVVCDNF